MMMGKIDSDFCDPRSPFSDHNLKLHREKGIPFPWEDPLYWDWKKHSPCPSTIISKPGKQPSFRQEEERPRKISKQEKQPTSSDQPNRKEEESPNLWTICKPEKQPSPISKQEKQPMSSDQPNRKEEESPYPWTIYKPEKQPSPIYKQEKQPSSPDLPNRKEDETSAEAYYSEEYNLEFPRLPHCLSSQYGKDYLYFEAAFGPPIIPGIMPKVEDKYVYKCAIRPSADHPSRKEAEGYYNFAPKKFNCLPNCQGAGISSQYEKDFLNFKAALETPSIMSPVLPHGYEYVYECLICYEEHPTGACPYKHRLPPDVPINHEFATISCSCGRDLCIDGPCPPYCHGFKSATPKSALL